MSRRLLADVRVARRSAEAACCVFLHSRRIVGLFLRLFACLAAINFIFARNGQVEDCIPALVELASPGTWMLELRICSLVE
jgi:hypothetical protein